jgi:hypothetical protein
MPAAPMQRCRAARRAPSRNQSRRRRAQFAAPRADVAAACARERCALVDTSFPLPGHAAWPDGGPRGAQRGQEAALRPPAAHLGRARAVSARERARVPLALRAHGHRGAEEPRAGRHRCIHAG